MTQQRPPTVTNLGIFAVSLFLCVSTCKSFVIHHHAFVGSELTWGRQQITRTSSVRPFLAKLDTDDDKDALYEAEEAAAVDAHDVSDPGMEGAAMERSVMMAQEMFAEEKKRSVEIHLNSSTDIPVSATKTNSDEDDDELYEAEEAAAIDAHDVSDPGMEGAAMERSVMMAQKMFAEEKKRSVEIHLESDKKDEKDTSSESSLSDDNDIELYEAEEAAAFDAHDVSDPGMEGAAMERSVMMAQEMFAGEKKRSKKSHLESKKTDEESDSTDAPVSATETNDDNVDYDDELYDAEEAAAFDAHDVSDPGMEGAAMERAVMLAQEMISEKRKNAADKNKDKKQDSDDSADVSTEHISVIETAAENLAQLIDSSKRKKDYEANEDYLSLMEEADTEELALLLLERAVMNAAVKVQKKAEERVAAATAAVEAAAEAKKFAAAFARRASEYAKHHAKDTDDLSDVAKHLADDAAYQVKLASDAEEKAIRQEVEAKGSLEQIAEKELRLKADLKELHDLAQIGVHQEEADDLF